MSIVPRAALFLLACSPMWTQMSAQMPPSDPMEMFSPADLAQGRKLFQAHCSPCHGIDGHGGRGPNLAVPQLKRARDNQALFDILQNGINGTIMDGAWQLNEKELWRIAAHVRSLGRTAKIDLPGNPERGRQLYDSNGCTTCHIVRGKGRAIGPELTQIGAQRSAAYLRESITDPGAVIPEEFVLMSVKTRQGPTYQGLRLNEDSFTLQLRASDGTFFSFRKTDLTNFTPEKGKSAMPPYGTRFSAPELDDLVAYLASLRGAQ